MSQPAIAPCTIRPAEPADVAAIVAITKQHELTTKNPDRVAREGFLISGYPPEKYLRWISRLHIAQVGEAVAGFTLSFRRALLPAEVEDSDQVYIAAGSQDFLLIKQVGVALEYQKRSIGRKLYQAILAGFGGPAFAPIIRGPQRNTVSIAFHEALGFRCVQKYASNGFDRGIWRWVRVLD
jgi:predicted GNAT superfamily acetyltransferase